MLKTSFCIILLLISACDRSHNSIGTEALKQFYSEKYASANNMKIKSTNYKVLNCAVQKEKVNSKVYIMNGIIEMKCVALQDNYGYSIRAGENVLVKSHVELRFEYGSTGKVNIYNSRDDSEVTRL